VLFEVAAASWRQAEQLEAKDDKIVVRDFRSRRSDRRRRRAGNLERAKDHRRARGVWLAGGGRRPGHRQGEPLHTMAYGATVAEVEVDTETGWVKVLKLAAPTTAARRSTDASRGQIDGARPAAWVRR